MSRILLAALTAMTLACGAGADSAAGAGDAKEGAAAAGQMQGMPGMAAAAPDTGGMSGMAMGPDRPMPVTARQAALAGVTFAVAREAPLIRTVRAVAMAVPNERGLGIVNARVSGWVEALQADETGRYVRRGQPLLELYAPELVSAQEELLLAKSLAGVAGGDSLLAAARRRLALWDISDSQIAEIERRGQVRRRLPILAPQSGYLLEKNAIQGQVVRAGERLFKIADLSTIWIEPAVFESDIRLVRVGQRAQVTFDALPGRLFQGRVTFVHPTLDMRTRTLQVRVEIANPQLLIKPMMYGVVRISTEGPRGVTVPLDAVLPTGTRNLAFVVRQGGVVPTPVAVAMRGDSTVQVSDGLAVGDTVVASATFLFDSESQLAAAMAGIMLNMGMGLEMGGMKMDGDRGTDMPGMKMPAAGPDTMAGMKTERIRAPSAAQPEQQERRP